MFHYLDNAATTRVCPQAAQAALEAARAAQDAWAALPAPQRT